MAVDLEFSIQAPQAEVIQPLLDEFEVGQHIHVKLRVLSWDTAWSDLVKVALYSDGPDVSEIGSTWLGDLVAMNAVHAFSPDEIALLGNASNFMSAAWQGCHLSGQPEVWAIPWLVGIRLLFYRRHLLKAADIDEGTAFQSAEQLDRTLRRLQEHGCHVPWTAPTGLTHTTLLNVCSWVWGQGGDFISPDGKRTLFAEPAARAGIRNYFALGRYIPLHVRHLNALQPDEQFLNDPQTAATISGPWLFELLTAAQHEDVHVALPPGRAFVGGSHLVLWKHTRRREAALKLIRFLTQKEAQIRYAQRIGLLPAQVEALAHEPYSTDPLWQVTASGMQNGRAFLVTRSWGLMEDRLTHEFAALWKDILAQPDLVLDDAIARHLEPLAKRLDLVLGQA
jgi:multiple sugar transport system substrate-binding protein